MTSGTSASVEVVGIAYDVVLERAQPLGPRGFCRNDGPAPRAFLFFAVAHDAGQVLPAVEHAPADMVPTCVPGDAEREVRAYLLEAMGHYAGWLIRIAAEPGHARWALSETEEAVLDISFQHELAHWATDIGQPVWAELDYKKEGGPYSWASIILRTASDGALLMGQYRAYTAVAKQPFEDTSLASLGFATEPNCTYYTTSCECGAPPSMDIRLFDVVSPGGDARVLSGGRGTFALDGSDYTLSVTDAKEYESCGPDEIRAGMLDLVVFRMQ